MTTKRKSLQVYWDGDEQPVGEVIQDSAETVFRYHPKCQRISHSLPVETGSRSHPVTFFENLLPDGVQRERLARRLGVSSTSTFAMLEAIGGDCAGALSLHPGERPAPQPGAGSNESTLPLTQALLQKMLTIGVVPTSISEGLRLSLAGAQDKLAVVVDDERRALSMPSGSQSSTHILKLPNRDFRAICHNEHFMLELAQEIGLPTAKSRLWPLEVDGETVQGLLIERFDRHGGRRLHQEDVLQALGRPSSRKYEVDGGPSLTDVVLLLDDASTQPGDVLRLVRWQAFNIAVGNNDGHAKNIARLREPRVCFAPAYDLVCTRAWPQLDKRLAFAIAGERDAGNVGPRAWSGFADAAHLSRKAVLAAVREVSTAVYDRAPAVAGRLIAQGAEARAVRNALEHVSDHAARALRLQDIELATPRRPRR